MRGAALGLLLTAAPAALAAATWADGEETLCEFIAEYDARPGVPSLSEQFDHMVFTPGLCVDPEGREVSSPLRLDGTVQIAPMPITAAEGEDRQRFLDTLLASVEYAGDFVRGATGLDLDVSLERDPEVDHRVFLVVRDKAMFDAAVEAGTSEAIGQDFPVTEPFVAAWSQGRGCFTEPFYDEAGQVADVIVTIIANLPLEDLATCVKGQMLNAAGFLDAPLGDASIWDDDWARWEPQGLAGEGYAWRDWALLRLLYHPEIPRGTPRADVMATLRAWHAARCLPGGRPLAP